MKRMLLVLLGMLLLLGACSSGANEAKYTLDEIIQAYVDNGIEVDKDKKPYYQMILAEDGVIFYMDQWPVKIYEYESVKALNEAKKKNDAMEDMMFKSNIVLETKVEKAIEIFESIE